MRNGMVVKHPLILPPIPREYLTFQCFARGEQNTIQESITVLVDETSPVVMNFSKVNETDQFLTVRCSGRAFPPPKIDLEISTQTPVEGNMIIETSKTKSTYNSEQVTKVEKRLELTIKCIVHNQYYSQNEELKFLFPPSPTAPPTELVPTQTRTSGPEPTVEDQENEVEVIKPKSVPEDVSSEKDDVTETDDVITKEDASTGTDSDYKTLLIYIISGVLAALILLIVLVCLVFRRTRTNQYRGMRKRQIDQMRGGATTSTSFTPYCKSPSPEDYYDVPTTHAIRKPPRSITPSSSKNNSLKRDKELSLRKGTVFRDSSLKRGTEDSSLRRNGSIHPADELEEYSDMRTFGSLKRKTGQYTEVEKRATLHGVYVLPSPPKVPAPKYSQIKDTIPRDHSRDQSRDPVYDNLDSEEMYDTPPHRDNTTTHYSPPFKKQETRTEYDKIEIDWDNSVQYDNMLSTGQPGTPISDI